tara:strand:- start:2929 stop:4194 length:1266 start_codon:yes stop_codon:yes gene_type:complete
MSDNKVKQLLEVSEQYYKDTSLEHRKKHGQYFTPEDLKRKALSLIGPIKTNAKVLENSCGSGEFIKSIMELNSSVSITAYDIDQKLVQLVKRSFSAVECHCQDYLLLEHSPVYDYVIGNPPYFQMTTKELKEKGYERFLDTCGGKPNIYSLFIRASIDSLKPDGRLLFVVPTSMNNGADFKKLRDYIIKTCDIENIVICGSKDFDSALQNVMILHLRKLNEFETNNGKYVFTKSNVKIFSDDVSSLEKSFTDGKTLEQLGFDVYTGNLVWNQKKEFMSRDNTDRVLVWTCNVVGNSVVLDHPKLSLERPDDEDDAPKYQKGQYVKEGVGITPLEGRCIVVNRVTGAGANAKIRAAILDCDGGYYVENHLNYIIKKENAVCELEDIHAILVKKETTDFIKSLTGNTQISKNELLKLIPFKIT